MSWSTGKSGVDEILCELPKEAERGNAVHARDAGHSKDAPPSSENDPRGTLTPVPDRARSSSSRRYGAQLAESRERGPMP